MAQYRSGSVAVTNGSPVVTGTDTEWLTEAEDGQRIAIDGIWYEILTVDDDDQVTLTADYDGETATGLTYAIHRDYTEGSAYPTFSYGDIYTGPLLAETLAMLDAQMAQLGSGAGGIEGTTESIFILRKEFTGTPADDAGILIERGTLTDVSILFKDSQVNKRWEFADQKVGKISELNVTTKVGIGQEPGTEALEVTGNIEVTGTYNGYTPLDAASYTAADVLTKIKSVDGSGSGLDTDLVRGTTPSTIGRTVLGAADEAAIRTAIGVADFVSGPASSTDGALVAYNGTTGKIVKTITAAQAKTFLAIAQSDVTNLVSDLALKAPLASPTFTGTPAAPTAAAATNTTQIATTAFVKTAIDNLLASAPGVLDTLDELAAALGDDPNFATTITASIATKLNSSAVSAFGLTLIDDADAPAARTTLGLGTAAVENVGYFATAGHDHSSMFHNNVGGEFAALTEKTVVAANDMVVIEDSAASNAKKFVKISNLPPGIAQWRFAFDSSTAMADPGSGEWRWNNATIASITALAISDVDAFAANIEASVLAWDDLGTSTKRGDLIFRKVGTPATYAHFSVTGSVTNNSGWTQLVLAHVASNGTWTAGDVADITFLPTGVQGSTGSAGTNAMVGPLYNFETTTTSPPGTNSVRFNNATLASVTNIYLTDAPLSTGGTIDIGSIMALVNTGDLLYFRGYTTPAQMIVFEVTGAPTDNTGSWTVPVTHVVSTGLPTNGNDISLAWLPRGLQGIQGIQGDPGDMTGPGSSVDQNIPVFDGITGALLEDSGWNIAELLDRANHTGAQATSTITGLDAALALLAPLASPTFTGTVTVPNDSFAFAKLQNIATARILGRNTASSGDIEELDASTVRTMLSLVVGTNVQAFHANLSAIAGLTSAANKIARFTGSGTADLLDFSTDGTLAGNSDTIIPSQKAIKTYVDGIVAANDAMVFKGVIDCSANPNYPAADRGHVYRVSVAGKIGGASGTNVEVGDQLLCLTDGTAAGTQAGVGASWSIIQSNIDGAVIGPSSAVTGDNPAVWDSTTGRLLKEITYATFKTNLSLVVADISGAAPLASPTFTGTPAAPTAGAGTSTTQLATTAFVQQEVPAASTTTAGKVEFATAAEYAAGSDTTRALNVAQVWDAADCVTLTDGATIAVNFALGWNFGGASNGALALGGNRALGAPTNVTTNQAGILWFSASGSTRTLTLNAAWNLATGVEAGPYSITTSQTLGVAYVVRGSTTYVTQIIRIG